MTLRLRRNCLLKSCVYLTFEIFCLSRIDREVYRVRSSVELGLARSCLTRAPLYRGMWLRAAVRVQTSPREDSLFVRFELQDIDLIQSSNMNKVDYMEVTLPNYSYIFNFEETFSHYETKQWMMKNWTNGFYYCGLYMILIFGGQLYMASRPRFELRGILCLWNTLLATFSIIGFTRTAPELIHVLRHHGLHHSICTPSFIEQDCVSGFWTWMFVLSKLPELGDTIFIVLRKQPLIFLHWYHHITVLLYSWFSYSEHTASARWYVVMNYCVHSIMYTYYALKAMRYRPPKAISMVITTLQLAQMVIGCAINISAYQYLESGKVDCHITRMNIRFSFAMYLSYFVLFARFFHKTYLARKKANKKHFANSAPGHIGYNDKLKAN